MPGERGAVLAEALRGGARYGDAERPVAAVLLGAGGGVDDDALAGAGGSDEDRGALGAGDDLQGVGLLAAEASADPLCDLIAGERAGLDSPTSRPPAAASAVKRRSIACSRARTASVVIRPPSRGSTRRSAIIARERSRASRGESSPTDCSSRTARNSPGSKVAVRSVRRCSTRSSSGACTAGAASAMERCPGCWAVKSKRAAVSFHACCRSVRVTSTLALRFSSLSARSSPRSGARPHCARKRSAALATSRLRALKESSRPRGTPAISK